MPRQNDDIVVVVPKDSGQGCVTDEAEDCIVGSASVVYTLRFPKATEDQLITCVDILRRASGNKTVFVVEDSTIRVIMHVDDFCSFPNTRPDMMSPVTAAVHDQTYKECRSANEYAKLLYEAAQRILNLEKELKEAIYVG